MKEVLTKEALMQQLSELTKELYYISDTEALLEGVTTPTNLMAESVTAFLLSATGQPSDAKVEVVSLADFFGSQFKQAVAGDEEAQGRADRFRNLQYFLEQQLQDIHVYRLGKRRIQVVILGISATREYIGLKTTIVEA